MTIGYRTPPDWRKKTEEPEWLMWLLSGLILLLLLLVIWWRRL